VLLTASLILMKIIIFMLTLLLICIYARSESTDSAYADYCIKLTNKDTSIVAGILFVKKNIDLDNILLNLPKTLMCRSINQSQYNYFESIIVSDTCSFNFLVNGSTVYNVISGQKIRTKLQEVINLEFPSSGSIYGLCPDTYDWRNGVQTIKNKLVFVESKVSFMCEPHLDTTFKINYHIRITGECK